MLPEQRVLDVLDSAPEGLDILAEVGDATLTVADLRDTINELDSARDTIKQLNFACRLYADASRMQREQNEELRGYLTRMTDLLNGSVELIGDQSALLDSLIADKSWLEAQVEFLSK